MSNRVICPTCSHHNSKHRVTCKNCRSVLGAAVPMIDELTQTIEIPAAGEKISGREAALKDMGHGALWCIGGIIVTAVTYSAASPGETYLVAWGAILFGGLQFLKGLFSTLSG